jgi:flagellar protein FlaE
MMPATVTMISLDFALPAVVLPGQGVPDTLGILWVVAGVAIPAVLGITDLLGDGDDEEEVAESDDSLFEDDGDDLGGLDGLDDMDGFEDEEDELGGGGDQTVNELESRLEELENEISSLSSSVNTVQNENEAVSETVTEVEDNVRDLLEIYEMVTRGVNPFVDEAGGTMGGGSGGSFGLFDDEGDSEEDVDDSIAEADAEEFFDDDFGEPGDDLADPTEASVNEGGDLGGDSVAGFDDDATGLDDAAAVDDATDTEDNSEDSMDDTDSDDSGKSFEELKQEYESGDPDWDVENPLDGESEDETETDDSTDQLGDEPATGVVDDDAEGAGVEGDSASENVIEEVIEDTQSGSEAVEDSTNEFVFEDTTESDHAPSGETGDAGVTAPGGDAGVPAPEAQSKAPQGDPEPSPGAAGADSRANGVEEAPKENGTARNPAENGTAQNTEGNSTAQNPGENGAARNPAESGTAEKPNGFEFVGEDRTEPDESIHLREFPEGYTAEVTVLQWIEYLIEVGGKQGARDVLGYYVDVGWISQAVEDELRTYLDGIRRQSEDAEFVGGGISEFDPEHHRQSLRFVARLAEDGDGLAMVERVDGATDLAVGAPKVADQPGGDLDGI